MCSSFFGHHGLLATPPAMTPGTSPATMFFTLSLCAKHNVPCIFSSMRNLDRDLATSPSTISRRQLPWSSSSSHSSSHFRRRCKCDRRCRFFLSFLTQTTVAAFPVILLPPPNEATACDIEQSRQRHATSIRDPNPPAEMPSVTILSPFSVLLF
ncbi:hypothetical protein DEO72_LG10g1873 [Vigna unguiculata]|uniref:Uncharacterized protein n=1 Tax=Vigna unguiculata TaxID=3917 RepID=A0A4D6NCK9_VIGUN|nr:hypothetical protein DEO72_LG10g1873 [Vigna unguiculata]